MKELIKSYQQQIQVFNNIDFDAENHSYLIEGLPVRSVTSILKDFVKPFDSLYWATQKAQKDSKNVSEVLEEWNTNNKISKVKGSLVHAFIQSKLDIAVEDFLYPEETIVKMFGYDPIQQPFHKIIELVQKFLSDIQEKMYPIASEFIVGDLDLRVCGTIDQLFFNKKSNQLEIWDWKTNKQIRTKSYYNHIKELSHIPDTEFDQYSLQLSMYKYILEKNTNIQLGKCYFTWFNENMNDYSIFCAKDYQEEINLILALNKKNELNCQIKFDSMVFL